MKVVVIEDEVMTAEDLVEMITSLDASIEVQKILYSVAEAVAYFKLAPKPDLIFCDIALGDGYSFEIFKQVNAGVPVIFCTAFNEYALEAFKNNGVDYILKPFSKRSIAEALNKFQLLKDRLTATSLPMQQLFKEVQQWTAKASARQSRLLVNWKDKIIPVEFDDIALFFIEYKSTQLVTFSGQKYSVSLTLEELEKICGNNFYRASRQYLINRSSVKDAMQYNARKLYINLSVAGNYDVTISKLKVSEFLHWLQG